MYNLEPAFYRALFGITDARGGNPFFVAQPPSVAFLVWSAIWLVVVLTLAIESFRRREI